MILLEHDENGNWVQIELTSAEAQKYLNEFEEGLREELLQLDMEINPPRFYANTEFKTEHYDKQELKLIETEDHMFEVWEYDYLGDECYKECVFVDGSYYNAIEKYREARNAGFEKRS